MKTICIIFSALLIGYTCETVGQTIHHSPIDITFNKTTSIVFPYRIKSVDRGSRDILAQKAAKVENVLQIKAGQRHFTETNLTVITSEGSIHQFDVRYKESPSTLTVTIPKKSTTHILRYPLHFTDGVNDADMSQVFDQILASPTKKASRDKQFGINFSVQGIFSQGFFMFYRIHINNSSNIDYGIDAIRIFIRDRQKVKRTATQEVEVHPVSVSDQLLQIPAGSSRQVVYVLTKMTIPDSKLLEIHLFEKDGGRDLKLKLNNRRLMKAKRITGK